MRLDGSPAAANTITRKRAVFHKALGYAVELGERGLERALARFMACHLGPGATPTAAMLTELLQIFLALGIAMPPTTSLLFRALATLEGTLRTLCRATCSSRPRRTSPPN